MRSSTLLTSNAWQIGAVYGEAYHWRKWNREEKNLLTKQYDNITMHIDNEICHSDKKNCHLEVLYGIAKSFKRT